MNAVVRMLLEENQMSNEGILPFYTCECGGAKENGCVHGYIEYRRERKAERF